MWDGSDTFFSGGVEGGGKKVASGVKSNGLDAWLAVLIAGKGLYSETIPRIATQS